MDTLYRDTNLVDVYDAINFSREDFDFYVGELPSAPAAILDIGCGTGTFAIELDKRGYVVTAVDPAPQMIEVAQRKDLSDSVSWVPGFVSDVPSDYRCDVAIMTGHAFQCLLTDAEITGVMSAVEKRLDGLGSFWFETRNPAAGVWHRWMPEYSGPPISLGNGRSVRVVHELVDVTKGFVTFEERFTFSDRTAPLVSKSTLRFLELEEIKGLASASGFEVADVFGNWAREPFKADSPEIIVRLTKQA